MENTKNILNEILLRMKYDSSKTLSENKRLMEQLNDINANTLKQVFVNFPNATPTTYNNKPAWVIPYKDYKIYHNYDNKSNTREYFKVDNNDNVLDSGTWDKRRQKIDGVSSYYIKYDSNSTSAKGMGEKEDELKALFKDVDFGNNRNYYTTNNNIPVLIVIFKPSKEDKGGMVEFKIDENGNKVYILRTDDGQISNGTFDVVNGDVIYKNYKITKKGQQPPTKTKRKYKPLNDNFVIYSYNKEHIGKLQDCLGMKIKESEKGFFGPKTFAALKNTPQFAAKIAAAKPITVAEINAVCDAKELPTLQPKELEKLPAQEPAKAQPATTQETTQQPQQELTGRARRQANRANKKRSQPEG